MSELKATAIFDSYWNAACNGDTSILVYLKSEADKVIAERKEKYNELAKLYDKAIQACCDADKVIAHHKYKRCLAMAKWCDEMMMSCELRGYSVHRIWANKHQWAMRWKYRWLELSEKFKEAK